MGQANATTTQFEAASNPPTTIKEPRAIIIEKGHTDLMPFRFWLDCFEFNNLRNAHERLCAIEDASIADFNYFQNLWRNREGGSMWGPPVPWQEWEGLQRKYNVAFFKMEKAMFEREVLATELGNHEYHRTAAICLARTYRALYVMARGGTIE